NSSKHLNRFIGGKAVSSFLAFGFLGIIPPIRSLYLSSSSEGVGMISLASKRQREWLSRQAGRDERKSAHGNQKKVIFAYLSTQRSKPYQK
ncbi:MAG: hypothetical protein MJY56_08325, partial [Bacteroidales bacterium]|nr:hypothetical protein [Bacteroidales bacterium]